MRDGQWRLSSLLVFISCDLTGGKRIRDTSDETKQRYEIKRNNQKMRRNLTLALEKVYDTTENLSRENFDSGMSKQAVRRSVFRPKGFGKSGKVQFQETGS